jgi:hypothetical protein
MAYRLSDRHRRVRTTCARCEKEFLSKVYRSEVDGKLHPLELWCRDCVNHLYFELHARELASDPNFKERR